MAAGSGRGASGVQGLGATDHASYPVLHHSQAEWRTANLARYWRNIRREVGAEGPFMRRVELADVARRFDLQTAKSS